jgi:hypothetical protein
MNAARSPPAQDIYGPIDRLCVDTIRFAVDAVEPQSGTPPLLGAAPMVALDRARVQQC